MITPTVTEDGTCRLGTACAAPRRVRRAAGIGFGCGWADGSRMPDRKSAGIGGLKG